ncbi:(Fe-S)-binding protein [Candidatus Woesearchaeota archaeon]|nr:(Fe-S)-binding protein [Candidatus Woesearchaeota archaeon]
MFKEKLENEVEDFLKQCTGCGKCMKVCRLPESDSMLVRSLNYATHKKSMPTAKTIEFAQKCIQCGACGANCPADCHRELMMLWLKARLSNTLPKGYKNALKYKGSKLSFFEKIGKYFALKKLDPIAGSLKKHIDKSSFKETPLLFYFGDSVYSPSLAQHKLTAIADYIGAEYEVLAGYKYSNGIQHYYAGLLDAADKMHDVLYDAVLKVNPTIIVTITGEDYEAMKNLQRYWGLNFVLKTATEWLLDNVAKLKLKGEKSRITFHDSCILSRKENKRMMPRKLLDKICTIVDIPQDKGLCMCCGFLRGEHDLDALQTMQAKKLEHVKTNYLGVECINCWSNLAPAAEQKKIKLTDVISLVYNSIEKEMMEEQAKEKEEVSEEELEE